VPVIARVTPAAVLALLATACGSTITHSSSIPDSLFDPPPALDPTVRLTASGADPQVLHVESPVTLSFVNHDTVAHTIEAAPELQYGDCPELNELRPMAAGGKTSVTLSRPGVICAYHDAAKPHAFEFQGIVVVD
jgi:plastocyanin